MMVTHHDHLVLEGAKCKVIDLLVVVSIRIGNTVMVMEQVVFREEVTELIPECAWIAWETGGENDCHEITEDSDWLMPASSIARWRCWSFSRSHLARQASQKDNSWPSTVLRAVKEEGPQTSVRRSRT